MNHYFYSIITIVAGSIIDADLSIIIVTHNILYSYYYRNFERKVIENIRAYNKAMLKITNQLIKMAFLQSSNLTEY